MIGADDSRALDWLSRKRGKGGVIAAGALGPLVPTLGDRQVWNGHWNWSPHAAERRTAARAALVGGTPHPGILLGMSPARFASATGARFALLGCGASSPPAVDRLATPRSSIHRFGCATVIELAPARQGDLAAVARRYGS